MDQAPESTKVGDQLRRICVLCALGFTALIVVLIGLETAGAVKSVVGSFFVLCPLALYVGIGLSSHAAGMSEFQITGQRSPRSSREWQPAPSGARRSSSGHNQRAFAERI